MKVPRDELRQRYARLPIEELGRIVSSAGSQYTREAREVAATVLFERRHEEPSLPPAAPTAAQRRSAARWAALSGVAALLAALANDVFRVAKNAGVDADVLLHVTKSIVRSPWTYALVITCALILWIRHRVQQARRTGGPTTRCS